MEFFNTVQFIYSREFVNSNEPIDYYVDVDDETRQINVYVNDVPDELSEKATDVELAEIYGLDTEYLISTIRHNGNV